MYHEEHREGAEKVVVTYSMVSVLAIIAAVVTAGNEEWILTVLSIVIALVAFYISHKGVGLLEAIDTVETFTKTEQAEKVAELYKKREED